MADDEQGIERREESRDDYGVARLLALSDGVFAIAMTLLVLNIPLPQLPADAPEEQVRRAFLHLLPNIGVFVLSFVLVGVYWMVHHRQFRVAQTINQGVLWLNLVALLTVCLVPFTTSFFSHFDSSVTATEVYYGNLLAAGLAFLLLTSHGHRSRALPLRQERQTPVAVRSLVPIAVFAGAMVLAPFWNEGARYAWVGLYPLNAVVQRLIKPR